MEWKTRRDLRANVRLPVLTGIPDRNNPSQECFGLVPIFQVFK
jgi:hypothetical protein